jgi:hypothetical protein
VSPIQSFQNFNSIDFDEDELFEPLKAECEINGFTIPAIIDTGAQISIMSTDCAHKCGLTNRIDNRYIGKAKGVGSGDIIGRIDNLLMRIGPISFKSRISILKNAPVDFLIGLDFLKRFDGEIKLKDNVLKLKVKSKPVYIPLSNSNNVASFNHRSYQNNNEINENVSFHKSALTKKPMQEYSFEDDIEDIIFDERVSMEGV